MPVGKKRRKGEGEGEHIGSSALRYFKGGVFRGGPRGGSHNIIVGLALFSLSISPWAYFLFPNPANMVILEIFFFFSIYIVMTV